MANKKKILILGVSGMLGHAIFAGLSRQREFDVYATIRRNNGLSRWFSRKQLTRIIDEVDADSFDSILKVLADLNPEVIINCIGIIKQRDEAKAYIPSIKINALFPHRLAIACRIAGVRLIHFSTDCVFSGKKGMYTHNDNPDADDLYGRTKYLGEVGSEGCLTIRSSIIGYELGSKFGLFEWFLSKRGSRVNGYRKVIYSGFTTFEMSRIVSYLITHHPKLSGVWNVASTPISKYDLLCLINEKMKLKIQIEPDDSYVSDRSLDGKLFTEQTGYIAPSWDKMVEEVVEVYP